LSSVCIPNARQSKRFAGQGTLPLLEVLEVEDSKGQGQHRCIKTLVTQAVVWGEVSCKLMHELQSSLFIFTFLFQLGETKPHN
jgi:hypothetical protein